MKKITFSLVLSYLVLIVCVIIALFPYLWTFLAATHTNAQVFNFEYTFHLGTNLVQNYFDLLEVIPMWNNLFSSLFIAVIYTVLVL